jgi:putative transposase
MSDSGPPSQGWRTFLQNHSKELISLDFLTVPTVSFQVLFVLVILSNDCRRALHFNVTDHPTAAWTAQQLVETCGMDEKPKYLLREHIDYRLQIVAQLVPELHKHLYLLE